MNMKKHGTEKSLFGLFNCRFSYAGTWELVNVCRDKNFSYHICYENIDGKQQNTPKSRDRQTMDHGP